MVPLGFGIISAGWLIFDLQNLIIRLSFGRQEGHCVLQGLKGRFFIFGLFKSCFGAKSFLGINFGTKQVIFILHLF